MKKNIYIKEIFISLFMFSLSFALLCSENGKDSSELSLQDRLKFFSGNVGLEGKQGRLQPGKIGAPSSKNKNNDQTRHRGKFVPNIPDPHFTPQNVATVPVPDFVKQNNNAQKIADPQIVQQADQPSAHSGFVVAKPSGRRRNLQEPAQAADQINQSPKVNNPDSLDAQNLALDDEEIIVTGPMSQEELNALADAIVAEERLLQEVNQIAKNADAMRIPTVPAPLEPSHQEQKLTQYEYDLERVHDAQIYAYDIENIRTSLRDVYGFDTPFVEAIIRNLNDVEALQKVVKDNNQPFDFIIEALDQLRTKVPYQRRYPCDLIETLLTKNFDANGEYIKDYREGGKDFRCTHSPDEAHLCAPLTAMAMRFLNNEHLLYSKVVPRRYYINTIEQLVPLVIKTLRLEEGRDVKQITIDAKAAAEKLLNAPNPQDSLHDERRMQRQELANVILQQAAQAGDMRYMPFNNDSSVINSAQEETPEEKKLGKMKAPKQPQDDDTSSYVIPRENRPGKGSALYIRKNDDDTGLPTKVQSAAAQAASLVGVQLPPQPQKIKTPSPRPQARPVQAPQVPQAVASPAQAVPTAAPAAILPMPTAQSAQGALPVTAPTPLQEEPYGGYKTGGDFGYVSDDE